jgi:hypothetical protein
MREGTVSYEGAVYAPAFSRSSRRARQIRSRVCLRKRPFLPRHSAGGFLRWRPSAESPRTKEIPTVVAEGYPQRVRLHGVTVVREVFPRLEFGVGT